MIEIEHGRLDDWPEVQEARKLFQEKLDMLRKFAYDHGRRDALVMLLIGREVLIAKQSECAKDSKEWQAYAEAILVVQTVINQVEGGDQDVCSSQGQVHCEEAIGGV